MGRSRLPRSALSVAQCALYLNSLTLPTARRRLPGGCSRSAGTHPVPARRRAGVPVVGAGRDLSGGEAQRIRLATQIGSGLAGVLYVLDEPSIGLHQRDNRRLIDTLVRLRDLGNTLIVVEHDEDTIATADWSSTSVQALASTAVRSSSAVPVAGLLANPESLTGAYLSGARIVAGAGDPSSGHGRASS